MITLTSEAYKIANAQCEYCDTLLHDEEESGCKFCCEHCDTNFYLIIPMSSNELPVIPYADSDRLNETEQQALTRKAYTAYKAKYASGPPYAGLREGEMEEIAGKALVVMKPLWRKK